MKPETIEAVVMDSERVNSVRLRFESEDAWLAWRLGVIGIPVYVLNGIATPKTGSMTTEPMPDIKATRYVWRDDVREN